MTTRSNIRLHGFPLSGHVHRVRLLLSLLKLPFEEVNVDLPGGEHKRAAFLARNPFGQVPVLEDGEVTLADSNAILVYLAIRYDQERRWLPADAVGQARVQRWLSVAAGELAHGPAAARLAVLFDAPRDPRHVAKAEALFATLDRVLSGRAWLAADHPTIADLAMYAYTSHAPEGGVLIAEHRYIGAWLERIEALPGFVGMARRAA
jgi:glutathione S-transferase